jgi:hypothetical protein
MASFFCGEPQVLNLKVYHMSIENSLPVTTTNINGCSWALAEGVEPGLQLFPGGLYYTLFILLALAWEKRPTTRMKERASNYDY